MKRSPFQSALATGLSGLIQSRNLSRRQIGIIAVGIIGLIYTLLLAGVGQPALAAPAQQTQPSNSRQITATPDTDTPDTDTLGAAFLSEYDRLSTGETAAPTSEAAALPDSGSLASTLMMSLLIVGGLAYVGIWGFKQYTARQGGGLLPNSSQRLSVQETQSIGTNQKLHLVRLGEEVLLVGATDHTITLLARYTADQFEGSFDEHLRAASQPSAPAKPSTGPQPVRLEESLQELRKVQRWQRGGDDA